MLSGSSRADQEPELTVIPSSCSRLITTASLTLEAVSAYCDCVHCFSLGRLSQTGLLQSAGSVPTYSASLTSLGLLPAAVGTVEKGALGDD